MLYTHIFIFHHLTVKLWIHAAITAWKGKFYWTIFITNINKTTLGYYKSIKCRPKIKTKPTRVQLKNEISTITTWLCTYIYNLHNGKLYCIHWLSWTKVQEMTGIQTDIERDLVEEKTSIYVHQFISTRESLNSLKFDPDIWFSTIRFIM